jgi:hypothetical protein
LHIFNDKTSRDAKIQVELEERVRTKPTPRELTVHQRRVEWMRKGWEDFHPHTSMYRAHDGFFVAASMARHWLRKTPHYQVTTVNQKPPADWQDAAWKQVAATRLIRGRSKAKAPVDNLGFPAAFPTDVKVVQDGTNLYVAFRCAQPEAINDEDSVSIELLQNNEPVLEVTVRATTPQETEPAAVQANIVEKDRVWFAFLTIPKDAIDHEGELRTFQGDFLRSRQGRTHHWSPPLTAPWTDFPAARRGIIDF